MNSVMPEQAPLMLVAKLTGAIAGSFISIAYILPRGRREAALRMAVGVATGMIFGGSVGYKLGHTFDLLHAISEPEQVLVGSAIASLSAWWALGAMQRLAETWSPLKRSTEPPAPSKSESKS